MFNQGDTVRLVNDFYVYMDESILPVGTEGVVLNKVDHPAIDYYRVGFGENWHVIESEDLEAIDHE